MTAKKATKVVGAERPLDVRRDGHGGTQIRGTTADILGFIADPNGLAAESARQIRERTKDYDQPIDAAVLRLALLILDRWVAGSPSDVLAHDARDAVERLVTERCPEALPWEASA